MKLDYPGGLTVNMDNVFSKSTEAPLTDTTGPVKNLQDVLGTSVEYRLAERYSSANHLCTISIPGAIGRISRPG
jgi:hypothetical protein